MYVDSLLISTNHHLHVNNNNSLLSPLDFICCRSAPPSPTHHPFMSSELNMEKYSVPTKPAVTSHFTLPQFFSQIAANSSSHSLPASPSRPPAGFTATPLKFFPMTVRSSSSDDLQKSKLVQEMTGAHDDGRDDGIPPPAKRVRIDERPMEHRGHETLRGGGDVKPRSIQMPTITSLPTGAAASLQPGGVQLFSIPLMSSAQHPPNLLNQPLSSFFPQNFFTSGSAAVAAAAAAHSSQQNQNDNGTSQATHSSDNEG